MAWKKLMIACAALALAACGNGGQQAAAPAVDPALASAQGINAFTLAQVSPVGAARATDNSAAAPDGTQTASTLVFDAPATMSLVFPTRPVAIGDTVRGSVYLWADAPTQAEIFVARACSAAPSEVDVIVVDVTTTPTRYEVAHTFQQAHGCYQFMLRGTAAGTLYAWKVNLESSGLR